MRPIGCARGKAPVQISSSKIYGKPLVLETAEVHIRVELNDICGNAGRAVLPAHLSTVSLKGINVTDTIRDTGLVGAYEDQIICHQGVAVEAHLIAVFADVVAPLHLTGGSVQSVESARAGTDEQCITHDRGGRENSTASLIFPAKFWPSRRRKVSLFLIRALSAAQGCHRH